MNYFFELKQISAYRKNLLRKKSIPFFEIKIKYIFLTQIVNQLTNN